MAAILLPQGPLGRLGPVATHGGLQAQAEADAVLKAEGCGGRPAHGLQQGQHPREVPPPPVPPTPTDLPVPPSLDYKVQVTQQFPYHRPTPLIFR